MAIGSSTIWGSGKSLLYQLFGNKIRIQNVAITGFTTYATNGVAYDLCGLRGFTETGTQVKFEGDATYTYVYDKTNNKILFMNTATGAEESALTDISGVTIKGLLIGR